jgi:hypothetical protein
LNFSSSLDFICKKNPMTVVERIKIVSDSYGKQKEFAAKVGIGEAGLSYLFKNINSDPKSSTIAAILKAFPKLSPKWLLLEEGKMWLTDDELQSFELESMEKTYEGLLNENKTLQKELSQAQSKIINLLEKK